MIHKTVYWAQVQGNIYWKRKMNVGNSFIILSILVEMLMDDVMNINKYKQGLK